MQMLLLIFRESLGAEIHDLLQALDVNAYTETPMVLGKGETGTAFNSFEWPGCNSMILAAMEKDQAERVVTRLQSFRDRLKERQRGMNIPFRVFMLPCNCVV